MIVEVTVDARTASSQATLAGPYVLMSVMVSPSSAGRRGAPSSCSSRSPVAYTLLVEMITTWSVDRSRTARRTWPGCIETSITASQCCWDTGDRAMSSFRSARTKVTPSGGALVPRAKHVTSMPRARASTAIARPRNLVPPSSSSFMSPILHASTRIGSDRRPASTSHRVHDVTPSTGGVTSHKRCDVAPLGHAICEGARSLGRIRPSLPVWVFAHARAAGAGVQSWPGGAR